MEFEKEIKSYNNQHQTEKKGNRKISQISSMYFIEIYKLC